MIGREKVYDLHKNFPEAAAIFGNKIFCILT